MYVCLSVAGGKHGELSIPYLSTQITIFLLVMAKMYFIIIAFLCYGISADSQSEIGKPSSKMLTRFQSFETCIDNFEIHQDKIIRAGDSRKMGAKYISETEMKTREDCLQLCCVTDACDVFVFEDKKSGSCYLFHCGTSADFKCKFTKHRNYTSGILAMNHQPSDVQEPNTLSKHEQELNQLRILDEGISPVEVNRSFGETPHLQANNLQKTAETPETNTCSRFQFKCRVSGECIAVYNACDGIPQCADGSDESPDLNCPVSVTSPLIPIVPAARNKTESDSPAMYDNVYQHPQQTMPITNPLKNMEQDNMQQDTSSMAEHNNPMPQRLNKYPVREPFKGNTLKKPEVNNLEPIEYHVANHQQLHFKKQEELLQNNSAPPYEQMSPGFQQFFNVPRGQDPDKLQEHNYMASKVVNEQTQHSKPNYVSTFSDSKYQGHMKYNFFQDRSNVNNPQLHNSQMPTFLNTEHMNQIHPDSPVEIKQQDTETNNAMLHLPSALLPEGHPHEYRTQQLETKDDLQREGLAPPVQHRSRLEMHEIIENKNKNEKEISMENNFSDSVVRNRVEAARVPSYSESTMQEIPSRLYKYDEGDKHIFTHKGYGLIANTDSPEMARKIVHYKTNYQENIHNNVPIHAAQNPKLQTGYPTSQEKLYKILKNTPQPVDGENGYLPDYMYDDTERQVPFDPHAPNNVVQPSLQKDQQNHVNVKSELDYPKTKAPENASVPAQDKKQSKELERPISKSKVHEEPTTHTENVKHNYVKSHQFVDLQQSDVLEPHDERLQDRPSAALLSMSFGLCITSIMAILVACRLKVVKRRFRRNGKSLYAHDADFLVNGMYL